MIYCGNYTKLPYESWEYIKYGFKNIFIIEFYIKNKVYVWVYSDRSIFYNETQRYEKKLKFESLINKNNLLTISNINSALNLEIIFVK